MNVAVSILPHIHRAADPLAAFKLRAWARATLWAACEYDVDGEFALQEAVDPLQRHAVKSGLVDRIGQDAVQAILRNAFHKVRQ